MKIFKIDRAWTYVWFRNYTVYCRYWQTNLLPPLMQPVVLLLIMGLGVGRYVDKMQGMPYMVFVTAGLLATESMLRSAFECTYGSFYRMKYQHTFEAIITTPVTPVEVAFGEIAWGATKSLISSTALFAVMIAIGVCRRPEAFLAFPIVALGGMNFSALSLAFSAKAREFEDFQFFFAALFPLTFVCGTYFSLERFPEVVRWILWAIPLTNIVDVTRSLISGVPTQYFFLKLAYIVISTIVMVEIALRLMAKRLID